MVDQVAIERQVIEALQTCYDPEIPVNIYDLGLIYGVTVAPDGGGPCPHDPHGAQLPSCRGASRRGREPGALGHRRH